jgi:hypothetical protein
LISLDYPGRPPTVREAVAAPQKLILRLEEDGHCPRPGSTEPNFGKDTGEAFSGFVGCLMKSGRARYRRQV